MAFFILQRKEGVNFVDYNLITVVPTKFLEYGLITSPVTKSISFGSIK